MNTLGEHVGGVAAVALAMGSMAVALSIAASLRGTVVFPAADTLDDPDERTIDVVETRFVRLGAAREPRRLPDRYVPSAATAPAEVFTGAPSETPAPSGADVPAPPQPASGDRPALTTAGAREPTPTPADAREDPLTRLGDRAAATAELLRPREQEGDPEGIAEGTATRDEADIYPGRLYVYFRRGWHVPTSLSDEEVTGLRCVVQVGITADVRVGAYRIVRSSGNPAFDQSVLTRMGQAAGAALPPPPPDEAERYVGGSVTLTFLGRHAR